MEKIGIMHSFDKCIITTKCCSFGNQYTPEGVKSDMKGVAIKQIQPPIKKQLKLLLGMVNHLSIICQIFLT